MKEGAWRRSAKHCTQVLVAAAAIFWVVAAFAEEALVVDAPAGGVRGEASGGVRIFRGIPYARPPVGELRWRPPQQFSRWRGVRNAMQFGAACMQPPSPFYDHAAMSEDCLFLNIWAPANARKAPVMVWIHGGSLISGAGSEAVADGAHFAERGVIVVSINYRLGALGYMAHPDLSAESSHNISGNYGLMDQIEALRWVKRNIAAFGGDPDNVTIAGQSAGALSVLFLMASPEARGLFHRAIAQSAYMITMPELRNSTFPDVPAAETTGVWLASQFDAASVADLRSMSATAIIERSVTAGFYPLGTIDGEVLPRQLVDTFDRGEQAPVPIIAGYNEGEIRSLPILLPPLPADAAAYADQIRMRYRDLAGEFLARYPAETIRESILATTRDAMYGWTAERLAVKQTAIGAASFLYYFDHGYPAADDAGYHAFHGAEIPFIFGTMASTPSYWPVIPETPQEQRLSDAMMNYWAAFAHDSVPSAQGDRDWGAYDEDRTYMAFEDAPHLRAGPPNGYALHETVVCRRRAKGGVAWNWNVGVIAPPLPPAAPTCQ